MQGNEGSGAAATWRRRCDLNADPANRWHGVLGKACKFRSRRCGDSCHSSTMNRRTTYDPRAAAEKAFKAVTAPKPAVLPPKPTSPPGVKEMVSLRIDRDVLDFFQEGGPGWQERINAALRKAAGKA